MKTPNDPRKVLEMLSSDDAGGLPFPPDATERARALATAPQQIQESDLEALPEPLALALVEAVIAARAVETVEALSNARVRSVAKAAKKGLYRLRSSGVAVPERKTETAAPAAPEPEGPPPALVSAITGNGERALIIGRVARGRIDAVQLVFSDEHGVVHLARTEISRGQYRKLLKEAHRPGTPTAVEIPLQEARALLAEAVGLNLRTRTPFPDGLDSVLRHLEVAPSEGRLEVPAPEDGDQGLAVRGATLHDEPELAQWLPPVEDLRALALKAQEVSVSPLYIDENQRAEQLRRTVQALAEDFFARHGQLYARRLWRMAAMFERTGRAEPAAVARAEARRMFHRAEGLFSPFGVRLFEKVLTLSGLPGSGAGTMSGHPHAGAPTQLPEPAPPGEHRSPGGLILP